MPLVGPASRLGYPIFMEIRSSALIAQTAQISYLRAIHTGNTTRASKLMGVMICHQLMALRQKLTIAFALWTEQDHPPRVGWRDNHHIVCSIRRIPSLRAGSKQFTHESRGSRGWSWWHHPILNTQQSNASENGRLDGIWQLLAQVISQGPELSQQIWPHHGSKHRPREHSRFQNVFDHSSWSYGRPWLLGSCDHRRLHYWRSV